MRKYFCKETSIRKCLIKIYRWFRPVETFLNHINLMILILGIAKIYFVKKNRKVNFKPTVIFLNKFYNVIEYNNFLIELFLKACLF